MKIIADNHADSLRCPGEGDPRHGLLLDTLSDELRTLHSDPTADLPDALVALVERLDRAPEADAR